MLDAIKPLVDSGIINEETQASYLLKQWEAKMNEAREHRLRAELREEFAQRYEHDKGLVMVEASRSYGLKKVLQQSSKQLLKKSKHLAEDRVSL